MIDWARTAFVFPGQGSQQVGMGADFYEAYPIARQTFQEADEILGHALSKLCFEGPEADLNTTTHTQPAMYVCSIAILRVLQQEIPEARAVVAAGHSLGELTALTAADALSFENGLRLVQVRGRLMHEAGEKSPGAMAAVLGLETDKVKEICATAAQQVGQPLVAANDNCPGQLVISGDVMALTTAMQLATEAGAKRVVRLPISIAAHSPLMQSAADLFKDAVEQTAFHPPRIPVYANATAQPMTDVDEIRARLSGQLTNPVRWTETVQAMISAGVQTFAEIGAGEALVGLIKRIDRGAGRVALNSVSAVKGLLV